MPKVKYSDKKKGSSRTDIMKEIAQAYHEVFDSSSGKRVLYDLLKQTHFMDSVVSYLPSGAVDIHDTLFNEGQRSVVMRILKTLKKDPAQIDELLTEVKEKQYGII